MDVPSKRIFVWLELSHDGGIHCDGVIVIIVPFRSVIVVVCVEVCCVCSCNGSSDGIHRRHDEDWIAVLDFDDEAQHNGSDDSSLLLLFLEEIRDISVALRPDECVLFVVDDRVRRSFLCAFYWSSLRPMHARGRTAITYR